METNDGPFFSIKCHVNAVTLLEFVYDNGGDIQYAEATTANSISTLIVRQYAQGIDSELKSRCLDLIDQMEHVGHMGIGDELAKIDR